jgi:hypothetical protein
VLEQFKDLPKEPLLYEAGGIIFASALMGLGHVMRRVLGALGRGGIWMLPYTGALLMFAAVGLHAYANFFLLPFMEGPAAQLEVLQFRFIALLAMLASSIAAVTGALAFWFMVTGFRINRA